MVHHGNV
jgi:hypothetical protein